jgi:hypothetical protein
MNKNIIVNNLNEKKFIFLLFLVGLLARVIFISLLEEKHYWLMSIDYFEIGKNLATGKGFTLNNQPVLFYEPGYSYFLAVIHLTFGHLSLFLVRLIMSLINCFNCLIIYKISKNIFPNDPLVAPLSFLLSIFYPLMIFIVSDGMETALFAFFISLLIWQLIKLGEKDGIISTTLVGVSFGLTSLIKPTVIPFLFLSLLWYFFIFSAQSWFKMSRLIIISITAFALILPWSIRNYKVSGEPILFAAKGGFNFWLGNNPDATEDSADKRYAMEKLVEFLKPHFPRIDLSIPSNLSPLMFDGRTEKLFYSASISYIKENPIHYLFLSFKKGLFLWKLYPDTSSKNEFSNPWVKLINIITYGPILLFGIAGIILSYRHWRRTSLLVLLFFSFTIVHAIFFPKVRFRIPLDPFLIIFCSYSLIYCIGISKFYYTKQRLRDHGFH